MKKNAPTIEIYPMTNLPDGSSTIHEGEGDPEFYDVIVRFYGDDPLEESEDHPTFAEAMKAATDFQAKYLGAEIEEINV